MACLHVERITTTDALVTLAPEWRRLAQAHGRGCPFTTWEWHIAWWEHLREKRPYLEDALFVHAFRNEAGDLIGIGPLVLTQRLVPLPVRVVDSFGADPNLTEFRGHIVHPDWEAQVTRALAVQLEECRGEWDWVWWRSLREGSLSEKALQGRSSVGFVGGTPNYILPLSGTWEEFKSSRPRNVKESLRKCYNSLKREGLTPEVRVLTRPEEMPAALSLLFALHRSRSEMTGTVQHPNMFEAEASRDFLQDACRRLAARGMVRVFQLFLRGQIVATRLAFAVGDTLYLYFSGYEPEWGRCSVMTTTTAEAIKYALANGFRWLNLSNGTDVSKTRWGPNEIFYRDALLASPTLRGRTAFAAYHALTRCLETNRLGGLAKRFFGRRASGFRPGGDGA